MNSRLLFLVGFVALYFTAPALSQDEAQIQLADLIEEALKNRPMLAADEKNVQVKKAQIGPQGSLEDPMFGFSATNYPIDSFDSDKFGMTGNEFSLTQRFPFPGKRSKLKSAAEKEYRAAEKGYETSRLDLIREVKLAYFQLYLAYEKKRLLDDQLTVVRSIVAASRSRYTSGKLSQAELLSVQLEEASLLEQVIDAKKEIDIKTGDLNHAVGRPRHHTIGRPEEFPKTLVPVSISEESLGKRALAASPRLKSMEWTRNAAQEKVSYARRGYFPDLELRAAYMQRQPSPGDPGTDFVTAGIGFSLPIWASSKQSEEIQGAKADLARWNALYEEEKLHLLHDIHTFVTELKAAQDKIDLLERGLLPLSEQALRSGRSAYLTGKIDYPTLLNLLRNRIQAAFSYHQARVNYETTIAELEARLGEPIKDSL